MIIIKGAVIRGQQLGRRMGFPTANIDAHDKRVENGVYRSMVRIGGRSYRAMTNVGLRPSVDGRTRLLEAHIFDFNQDIYGETIQVELLDKIRDEKRFESIEELQRQLEIDAQQLVCRRVWEYHRWLECFSLLKVHQGV